LTGLQINIGKREAGCLHDLFRNSLRRNIENRDLGEPTEMSYYTPKKRKKSPKEYEDIEEVGDISSK